MIHSVDDYLLLFPHVRDDDDDRIIIDVDYCIIRMNDNNYTNDGQLSLSLSPLFQFQDETEDLALKMNPSRADMLTVSSVDSRLAGFVKYNDAFTEKDL